MTAKTVLLHIGTMKTGNTSIHHSLAHAQESGSLGGVCFPRWKGEDHQSRLAVLYCHDELGKWPSIRERYPADARGFRREREHYRRFIFDELESATSAILSAESFGHLFNSRHAAELRHDLRSCGFRDFKVVLYVRDPADYYLSMAQQNLRMSDEPPFIKDPAAFVYPFLRIAETWEQAFPGQLTVRKFPPDTSRDILEDFSNVLMEGLGVALPGTAVRRNSSISAEGMQILQEYRQTFWPGNGSLTPDTARLARLLSKSTNDVPQSRARLKPELAQLIRAHHANDAEVLKARYGVDLGRGAVTPTTLPARREHYRVEDIVESVDPVAVRALLLLAARLELERSPRSRITDRFRGGITRLRHVLTRR